MRKLRLSGFVRKLILRGVVPWFIFALAVPLLEWTFNPHTTVRQLAIQYLYSLVYTFCIGNLLNAFVPRVWVPSSRFSPVIRWLTRATMVVLGTTVGCLTASTIMMVIVRGDYDFREEFVGSLKIALILSTATAALIVTLETYKYRLQATAMELKSKELERERALSVATQMRLASLQSRVHPHFLFNTINSISSLLHDDPERAEDMLSRMADLLRFSLDSAQPGLIPLERELSIVKDYLEIEKARFGDRLRYEMSALAGSRASEVLIPPLSIQTLVENSIKYAVNARREGASIQILLNMGGEDCSVTVKDDGPGFGSVTLLAGHGLDNLEERLSMLFGEQGHLQIKSTGSETSVSFTVPRGSARNGSGAMNPRGGDEHEYLTRFSG